MPLGNPIQKNNDTRIVSATATTGQTDFTITGGYTINAISVFRNGVRLSNSDDFTASDGSTVSLTVAADVGDTLDFHIFDKFTVANAIVGAAATQTISGNLTITGELHSDDFRPVNETITGISTIATLNVTGTSTLTGAIDANSSIDVAGTSTFNDDVTFTGAAANVTWDKSTDDLIFNDNAQAKFGTSGDLSIYHDSNDSFIKDSGTGGLVLCASQFLVRNAAADEIQIQGLENGAVSLYHDNTVRLTTTTSGVSVGNDLNVAGVSTFTGDINVSADINLADWIVHTGDLDTKFGFTTTDTFAVETGGTERIRISALGLRIGTNSVTANTAGDDLTIEGSSDRGLSIISGTSSSGNIYFGDSGDADIGRIAYQHNSNQLEVYTNASGSPNVIITSAGLVGIGSDSPQDTLDVAAAVPQIRLTDTSDGSYGQIRANGGNLILRADEGNTIGSSIINFEIDGDERARINSSGNMMIGDTVTSNATTDADNLVIGAASGDNGLTLVSGTSGSGTIRFSDGANSGADAYRGTIQYTHSSNFMRFYTNASEACRIDSSGRLLVGTTADVAGGSTNSKIQVVGTSYDASVAITANRANASGGNISFAKTRAASQGDATVVQSGDTLGSIVWYGADGTDTNTSAAQLDVQVDTTPGSNDMPGRFVFRTTADGAATSTERMRIDSAGKVGVGHAPSKAVLEVQGAQAYASSASTLATAVTKSAFRVKGSTDSSDSLWMGVETSDANPYIQAANDPGTASQELLLNPFGGFVGINQTVPLVELDIKSASPEIRLTCSNAALGSGETIGQLGWYTTDTTTPGGAGTVSYINTYSATSNGSDYTTAIDNREGAGGGSTFIKLGNAVGAITFGTNTSGAGTERWRIRSNGHLESNNTNLYLLRSGTTGDNDICFGDSGDDDIGRIRYDHDSDHLSFLVNASERMRIDSSGRLLIGTTVTTSNQSGGLNVYGTDGNAAMITIRRGSDDAGGPRFAMCKSRGTTDGSYSGGTVADNDALGTIHFYANDNQGYEEGASIAAEIDGSPGGNDVPTRLVFDTTPDGSDTKQERMRITANGDVGINCTPAANSKLHIKFGTNLSLRFNSGQDSLPTINSVQDAGAYNGMVLRSDNLRIFTGVSPSERMRILADGAVCINATARPVVGTEYLGVQGGSASNAVGMGAAVSHQGGVPCVLSNSSDTSGQKLMRFAAGSGGDTRGEITYNGSAMVYGGTSDYRLKKNVAAITDGITKLKNLNPINFNWISSSTDPRTVMGFLAHEVQEVMPEVTSGTKDAVNSDTNKPEYMEMDYGRMSPLIVAALKDAIAKIETLETKVAALESA